jgi:hypothetical protein
MKKVVIIVVIGLILAWGIIFRHSCPYCHRMVPTSQQKKG